MAVPKQRKTKSRRNQRRMHQNLSAVSLAECSHCGEKKRPHTVCKNCGYYKGREVLDVMKDLKKKERKEKEKEIKAKEKQEKEKKPEAPTLEELSKKKF